jgi:uncharacterized protein YaaR (DUF327 family)
MDKIDFSAVSFMNPPLRQGSKKETKKARSESAAFFQDILESYASQTGELGPFMEPAPSDEALTQLMDAVHSTGNDLSDRPFQQEILQYKKAVRNFIHYVVKNGFAVEEIHTSYRDHRKLKPYMQIQVIDHKLEELAAAILSGQTNQLERVSKLDEIKGLLVDLTVTGVIRQRDE